MTVSSQYYVYINNFQELPAEEKVEGKINVGVIVNRMKHAVALRKTHPALDSDW